MAMKTTFLRSKVARRIFALFVCCALLPVVALAILSFYQVSNQLKTESQKQLQQATKAEGLAIYERLTMLDEELQVTSLRVVEGEVGRLSDDINSHFQDVTLLKIKPESLWLPRTASFTPSAQLHLRSGKTLIKTDACPGAGTETCVVMLRMVDTKRPESGMLVGQINSAYLWGMDQLPAGYAPCVRDSVSRPLYCFGDKTPPDISTLGLSHNSSGFFRWKGNKTLYDAAYWGLLLRPRFAAESWTIVLSRNREDSLAPMEHFRSSFPFVIALAVWIVVLLSLIEIRRTLVPLEKLREATTHISEKKFERRVEIDSGDEFQDLANAFNIMSTKLGRQFHALATTNEIDHAILASLNREGIVTAVLHGVASLLPCDSCGVALFEEEQENGSFSMNITLRTADAGQQTTVRDLHVASSELLELRNNPSGQVLSEGDGVPRFLWPFAERGMKAYLVVPVFVDKRLLAAIVCAHSTTLRWREDDFDHARRIADQLAVGFSNVQLIEAHEELHWGALTALARAIDASSSWTAGHSERVTELAINLGRAMGLSTRELLILNRGGLLHDVGKIGTPSGILEKPGRLDAQELEVMRDHVRTGVRILEPIPSFKEELLIVAQHHEWFDGSGYPAGLAGEDISLFGRIFAVADCFDALTSDRPYRKGMPKSKALELLRKESGTHFDPKIIATFERLLVEDEGSGTAQGQGHRLMGQLT
jgi:putative nucleotidyltransferase with HDIG domain